MAGFADPIKFADNRAAAPAIPAIGGGSAFGALKQRNPRFVRIELLRKSGTVTLTGPVAVYVTNSRGVFKVAELNRGPDGVGDDIALPAAAGYAEVLQFASHGMDSFEVVPAAVAGGGNYDGFLVAIDES